MVSQSICFRSLRCWEGICLARLQKFRRSLRSVATAVRVIFKNLVRALGDQRTVCFRFTTRDHRVLDAPQLADRGALDHEAQS